MYNRPMFQFFSKHETHPTWHLTKQKTNHILTEENTVVVGVVIQDTITGKTTVIDKSKVVQFDLSEWHNILQKHTNESL